MRYLIEYFRQIKRFIGRKAYYIIVLVLIVGFIEGIGITLFLPILQSGFGDDRLSMILKAIFDFFKIGYSFELILVFILLFFTLRAVSMRLYVGYFGRVSTDLIVLFRRTVLNKIFAADYIYILKKELGSMSNIIAREISRAVDAFDKFASVVSYIVFGLIYLALSSLLNFRATFILIAICPFLSFFIRRINSLTNEASLRQTHLYGKMNAILIQALSKLKYLKATLSNLRLSKIIDNENKKLGEIRFKLVILKSVSRYAFEPVIIYVVVALLFYHVVILKRNVSEVIFLSMLFLQIARQFLNAQSSYRKFLAARGSIKTFDDFLKELEDNQESLNVDGKRPDFEKDISLRGVTVVFPNGKKALDNVSINIRPRSMVALVGHSGSGKSTVANIVTGLLKPAEGEVFFGDTNYRDLNLKELREKIGYVTQEDVIFNASVKDNVSLWDEGFDKERLNRVIGMAYIEDFVAGLKEREDAMLGENGLDISGGQRQRITIARELYKKAKILILDEATSSLDTKAEKRIYENLKRFKGKTTMLVIAHRLSTIKNADYIYVMDTGRIIEEGMYDELMNRRGEFKSMIEDQSLPEDKGLKLSQ